MALFGDNGEVRIPVGLDTKNAQADAKALKKDVEEAFSSSAMQKQNKELQNVANSMKQAYVQANELASALEAVRSTPIPTEPMQKLTAEIRKAEIELRNLEDLQAKWDAEGKVHAGMDVYDKNVERIGELKSLIADCTKEQQELTEAGKAYTIDTEKAHDLELKLDATTDKLKIQLGNYNDIVNKQREQRPHLEKVKSLLAGIGGHLKNTASHFKSGLTHLLKWPTAFRNIAARAKGVKTSISNIAKGILQATLKIGGFVATVRLLTGYAKEGFTNLAKEGARAASSLGSVGDTAADSIRSVADSAAEASNNLNILTAKFTQLKNSIGAAISPLLNAVIPVIERVVDLLTRAFNAVAMFFGALTGKKSVQVAKTLGASEGAALNADKSSGGGSGSKKKTAEEKYQEAVEKAQAKYEKELARYQEKVAKAEDKQAKAAAKLAKEQEKVNKQLQGFDELNNLTTDDMEDNTNAMEDYMAGLEEPELVLPDRDDFVDAISGGGGGGGAPDMFEEMEIPSMFEDLVDKLKEMWEKADFTELGKYLGEQLKSLLDDVPWEAIQKNADKLGKSLATLINGFVEVEGLGESIGKTFAEGLNTIFHFLDSFVRNFHWRSVGSFIAETANGWFENIDWDLIKDTFVTGFRGLANSISQFVQDFHWENLSDFASNVVNTLTESIATFFNTAQYDDKGFKKNNRWLEDFADNLWDQIGDTIKKIDKEKLGEAIGSMIQALIDLIAAGIRKLTSTDWLEVKNALQEFFSGVAKSLKLDEPAKIIASVLVGAIALKLLAGTGVLTLASGLKSLLTGSVMSAAAEAGGLSMAAIFVAALAGGIAGGKLSNTKVGRLFQTAGKDEGFGDSVVLFGKMATEANAVSQAMEQIDKGYVYTTEDLRELQQEYGLSEENVQKLQDAMWDTNTELDNFRSKIEFMSGNEGMFSNMNAGDLLIVKSALDDIGNGYVENERQLNNWLAKYERASGRSIELSDEQREFLLSNLNKYNSGIERSAEEWEHAGDKLRAYKATQDDSKKSHEEFTKVLSDTTARQEEFVRKLKDQNSIVGQTTEELQNQATQTSTTGEQTAKFQGSLIQLKDTSTDTATGLSAMSDNLGTTEGKLSLFNTSIGQMGTSSETAATQTQTNMQAMSDAVSTGVDSMSESVDKAKTTGTQLSTGFGTNAVNTMKVYKPKLKTGAMELLKATQQGVRTEEEPTKAAFKGVSDASLKVMQEGLSQNKFTTIGVNALRGLISGFDSMKRSVISKVQNIVSEVVSSFSGLSGKISSIMGEVVGGVSSTLGEVSKNVSESVKSWQESISSIDVKGEVETKINTKTKIKGYASGQVIPPNMAKHLAILGDNNKETEVVSPLSTMKDAFLEAMAEGNFSGGDIGDIVIQIDGYEVFRAVRRQNDIFRKSTGSNAFA